MSVQEATVDAVTQPLAADKAWVQATQRVLPNADQTLTLPQLQSFLLTMTPTAPRVLTMPVAASMIQPETNVADAIPFFVRNLGAGANTITLDPDGASSGNLVIETGETHLFLTRIDTAQPAAYTLFDLGAYENTALPSFAIWALLGDIVTGNKSVQEYVAPAGVTYEVDWVMDHTSTNGTTPRLVFYKDGPSRGALCAGNPPGSEFNRGTVGAHSLVIGTASSANGPASVGLGENADASGTHSHAGGSNSFIAAGGDFSFIGGGSSSIGDNVLATPIHSTVGGGNAHEINTDAAEPNWIVTHATIGGGRENVLSLGKGTICGGFQNTATGPTAMADSYATVFGGGGNDVTGNTAPVIGGGSSNTSTAVIGGGNTNTVSGTATAVIFGGTTNSSVADLSSIWGGTNNDITDAGGVGSVVCGTEAQLGGFEGCFLFSTAMGGLTATADNQAVFGLAGAGGSMRIDNGAAATLDTATAAASLTHSWTYIPGDAADWDGSPATVSEALDRLAAVYNTVAMAPVP